MSQVYEITAVAQAVRDWNSTQGGPMKGYRIDLKTPDGAEELLVEWSRKAASPMPAVGQSVEGDIEQTNYGKKFKKAQTGGGFGGVRMEDPKRQAAIVRQHSQTAALTVLTLKQQLGVLSEDDLTPAKLSQLADFFDDDVRRGVARAGA